MADMTLIQAGNIQDYPHLFPPPGFVAIDRNRIRTITGPGEFTLETISEVAQGMEGWIRWIGLESGDFTATFFRMLQNGQPMKDYTQIEAPIGSTATPRVCFIKLPGNYTYTLQCVATAAAVNVSLRWSLFGWYYPIAR